MISGRSEYLIQRGDRITSKWFAGTAGKMASPLTEMGTTAAEAVGKRAHLSASVSCRR